jgi:aryl-alcohol dehydrogenase-like predicted oxidoreductase
MTTRRTVLQAAAVASAALLPAWHLALAAAPVPLKRRTIAATGESVPVIGLGTSGNFEVGTSAAERDPLREVLARFFAAGARVIDTAPSYGSAESVLGDLLHESGKRGDCFLASKLSSVGRESGLAQFEASLRRLRTDRLDLLQVHNLRDWRVQLDLARELKREGRVRLTGITHYVDSAHDEVAVILQRDTPDFLQINYSVASPNAAKRLLPLAQDLGIAVMINRAFEDGRLFERARGLPLPKWAADVGVATWAQMFLKFVLAHPAVTTVIPATSKPERQTENLAAGIGPDLDRHQCAELIALFA